MPTTYEIPLSPDPQYFAIPLAGITYNMTLLWNVPANCWVLDIADSNKLPIINGTPLVTGIDLLGQFKHLGFGGALTVETDGDIYAVPTFDNLGDESHVYFTVP